MQTTVEFLGSVLRELANAAASGANYSNWSDEFARKQVREVWQDDGSGMRRKRERTVTVAELKAADANELHKLGFAPWSEKGPLLIPIWAWNYIAEGETLTSISGEKKVKTAAWNDMESPDYMDTDTRFGCTAWGFS